MDTSENEIGYIVVIEKKNITSLKFLLLGVSLDIDNYCTLRPFFVLPGRGKGDRSR